MKYLIIILAIVALPIFSKADKVSLEKDVKDYASKNGFKCANVTKIEDTSNKVMEKYRITCDSKERFVWARQPDGSISVQALF